MDIWCFCIIGDYSDTILQSPDVFQDLPPSRLILYGIGGSISEIEYCFARITSKLGCFEIGNWLLMSSEWDELMLGIDVLLLYDDSRPFHAIWVIQKWTGCH